MSMEARIRDLEARVQRLEALVKKFVGTTDPADFDEIVRLSHEYLAACEQFGPQSQQATQIAARIERIKNK